MIAWFQDTTIDAVKLAKEIAKNIPPPQGEQETWIFALFALSGWVVGIGIAWWNWHKDKQRLGLELKRSEIVAQDKQADKELLERLITAMVETQTAMKAQTETLKDLSTKIESIAKDVLKLILKK